MAIAKVNALWRFGMRTFDSSVSGLGGATEDVVYLLHGLGGDSGIDLDALVDTSAWISERLGREPGSRVARAMLAKSRLNRSLSLQLASIDQASCFFPCDPRGHERRVGGWWA